MADWDPSKFTITWAPVLIDTGFAPGTFISGVLDEDQVMAQAGADGFVSRAINNNLLATVTVTLQSTSPKNAELSAVLKAAQLAGIKSPVAPFFVNDRGGTTVASASLAWIKKLPDLVRGKEITETAWQFHGRFEIWLPGGN